MARNSRVHTRGRLVQVRPLQEILSTLDAESSIEGIPFMPEMAQYCGRTFTVAERMHKICIDEDRQLRKIGNVVLLEDLRCDGSAHEGCGKRCRILWKEEWLRPAPSSRESATEVPAEPADPSLVPVPERPGQFCQATEIPKASTPLPWWHADQYMRDLSHRSLNPLQLAQTFSWMLWHRVGPKILRASRARKETVAGTDIPEKLDLQAGEWVIVRSREEIDQTLDKTGRHRGLSFQSEMYRFCGGRYRVANRLERMVSERSGKLVKLENTVLLEGLVCDLMRHRGCHRALFHYWRECWLKRPEPESK